MKTIDQKKRQPVGHRRGIAVMKERTKLRTPNVRNLKSKGSFKRKHAFDRGLLSPMSKIAARTPPQGVS